MEKSFYRTLINFDCSQKAVLCSLLQWKGSVPRKDYPQMLVLENGTIRGTIGGGNIEHTVIELAKSVIQTNESVLKEFDLSNQEVTSEGGICGGHTRILVEPFTTDIQSFWKSLKLLERPDNDIIVVTEVTNINGISSHRYYVDPDNDRRSFPTEIGPTIQTVRKKRKSKSIEAAHAFYLVQLILPPTILHIFGAGHIAKAVAELAHFIDLDVYIYDDRQDLASATRFPHAKRIHTESLSKLRGKDVIPANDLVLVATRGHQLDFELMRWLLTLDTAYLGLMSSRAKWRILSQALKKDGFISDQLNRVHAPVGLDIDSETVPEIAVSIISEIIHFYRTGKRSGKSLSGKS